MKVGMGVAAIGNALGLGTSMAGGWVRRLNASISLETGDTLYNLMEIDVAINPGNSGGPLVNTAGEVIGITNAKLIASGVEGIGYAIPSNVALPIITDLITKGSYLRPYLGVSVQTVTPSLVRIYRLSVDRGALVTSVTANSPASQAGLREGDVIVRLANQEVGTADELIQILRSQEIGRTVPLVYWRGANQQTAQVTLAAQR